MKVRSVIIQGVKDVVVVEEELAQRSLAPQECLIETTVSMISPGTELSRVYGLKKGAEYPVRPGYCAVGKILTKGDQLKGFEVGDIVLYGGTHSSCQYYDRSTRPVTSLYKLNPKLTHRQGAMLMMCWIAKNGILSADVKLGDTVAIFGMGNLGIILAILYQEMGIKVIGVDPVENRCQVARSMGIETLIQCAPQDQVQEVFNHTKGQGADIVVDASGMSAAIENAILSTASYGQVVLLGSPREDYTTNATLMLNAIHMRNITVIGALNRMYPFEPQVGSRLSIRRSLDYLTELMLNNTIDAEKFLSHTVKPEDIMKAYDGLMNHKDEYTGVIVDWTI